MLLCLLRTHFKLLFVCVKPQTVLYEVVLLSILGNINHMKLVIQHDDIVIKHDVLVIFVCRVSLSQFEWNTGHYKKVENLSVGTISLLDSVAYGIVVCKTTGIFL